ncbi:ribonuclease [Mesorhizobium sp. Z1-4]|uniref:ribonuclease T2 family protein n=1 Tax=Mesorhizobium sp. Z1-4 TaxID=2448478 RepID=UPI000FD799DA|nr:ribonuclease [Mesorhizobium sp. Z1-4]
MHLFSRPALALASLLLWHGAAASQDKPVAAQGSGFDFYVISLSWSPSYCAEQGLNANRRQCGIDRDYAFIAHGLWPQYASGYPEFCSSSEPERVPNALVGAIIDIMPSAGLVGHQWRKHGSCTGLTQAAYLEATREAYERVAIPPELDNALDPSRISADAVESAFISANPGLPPEGIAVSCKSGRLTEVRICLTKQLEFRSCSEVDARGCRASNLYVPSAP